MCRSIKTLRRQEEPVSDDEIHAAALQFVRKVSGFRAPSRANQAAFDDAVSEIADASRRRTDDVPRIVGSHARATRDTGWAPRIPLAETLGALLADWRVRVAA